MVQEVQYTCPCCGNSVGSRPPIEGVIEGITSEAQRSILEVLSKPVGRLVSRNALIEAIWQFQDEPEGSENTMYVQICRLRKTLTKHGWSIITKGGRGLSAGGAGAFYRLVPSEAPAWR